MNDSPPINQEIVDQEHLKLLSIFHYVYGALQAALSTILIFHFIFGLVIAIAPHLFGEGRGDGPPTIVGLLMAAFAGCFMVVGWIFGALTIYSGVCIKRRRNRTFSLVIAVLNCLSIPFGTLLGVFTIVVLSRGSVRKLYENQPVPVRSEDAI